jgi:hypothetical protein
VASRRGRLSGEAKRANISLGLENDDVDEVVVALSLEMH